MAIDVMQILDKTLQTEPGKEFRIPSATEFNPTEASVDWEDVGVGKTIKGMCRRRVWYTRLKPELAAKEPKSRVTVYGDLISEVEVDLAKRAGIYLGHEVSFSFDYKTIRIRGRVDLLTEVTTNGGNKERIGVEFKSIGNYHARKGTIVKEKNKPYLPQISHILQAAIYLHYYARFGFTHWQIVYIDRGFGDFSSPAHKVFLDDKGEIYVNGSQLNINILDVFERWNNLSKNILNNEIPERDFELSFTKEKLNKMADAGMLSKTDVGLLKRNMLKKGDWNCEKCPFLEACWGPQLTESPLYGDLTEDDPDVSAR